MMLPKRSRLCIRTPAHKLLRRLVHPQIPVVMDVDALAIPGASLRAEIQMSHVRALVIQNPVTAPCDYSRVEPFTARSGDAAQEPALESGDLAMRARAVLTGVDGVFAHVGAQVKDMVESGRSGRCHCESRSGMYGIAVGVGIESILDERPVFIWDQCRERGVRNWGPHGVSPVLLARHRRLMVKIKPRC